MRGLFILLSFPVLALSTTRYVSTTGSDANGPTCPSGSPCLTIQRAVNGSAAGDTVIVNNGTYGPRAWNGSSDINTYSTGTDGSNNGHAAMVCIGLTCISGNGTSVTGTPGNPITIKAANPWGAILDGGMTDGFTGNGSGTSGNPACNCADDIFQFDGSSAYFVIQDFVMQRTMWTGAFMNNGSPNHISFIHNHFFDIGHKFYCVIAGGSAGAWTNDGGTLCSPQPGSVGSYGSEGIFSSTGTFIVVDRNQFDNIGRLPQQSGCAVNDDFSHDHGMYISNTQWTITNNIFYNNYAGWNIQTAANTANFTQANIVGNTLVGAANPCKFGTMILYTSISNVTIENNIMYNGTTNAIDTFQATLASTVISFNLVYPQNSSANLISSGYSGSFTSTGNIYGSNPLFTSASTNNYHLQSTSPAIGTGTTITDNHDFDNNVRPTPSNGKYDMGAYEFVFPPPVGGMGVTIR